MGKSSSRKLRYVIYYTLYRMDPQKTHYKISSSAKISKIKKWGGNPYIFPPFKGGYLPTLGFHRNSPKDVGTLLQLVSTHPVATSRLKAGMSA